MINFLLLLITFRGVLLRRWRPMKPGVRYDIELVLKANNVDVCNDQKSIISNKEVRDSFTNYWQKYNNQELHGRNHILRSFCPQVSSRMLTVKLNVLLKKLFCPTNIFHFDLADIWITSGQIGNDHSIGRWSSKDR